MNKKSISIWSLFMTTLLMAGCETIAQSRNRQAIQERENTLIITRAGRPAPSGYGYEHKVQAGETLSEIARAYNVRINAIIDANNLTDPDQLKVGKLLFIPE